MNTWPEAITLLGIFLFTVLVLGGAAATWLEYRKTKVLAAQQENFERLVSRYEQLAEKTLDAQQRAANDVAELRSRAAAIEQILRTVE